MEIWGFVCEGKEGEIRVGNARGWDQSMQRATADPTVRTKARGCLSARGRKRGMRAADQARTLATHPLISSLGKAGNCQKRKECVTMSRAGHVIGGKIQHGRDAVGGRAWRAGGAGGGERRHRGSVLCALAVAFTGGAWTGRAGAGGLAGCARARSSSRWWRRRWRTPRRRARPRAMSSPTPPMSTD